MSVVIRSSRVGKKGERKFRIVVAEKRSKRDGEPIDSLGWYEKGAQGTRKLDKKKFDYWVLRGAIPSNTILKLYKNE
jgi:small subunit ribosomal protein S16